MQKLLVIAALALLACCGAAYAAPARPETCELQLTQQDQRLSARVTCLDAEGKPFELDNKSLTLPSKHGSTCKPHIENVEQVERNAYFVHTVCDTKSTLVFQLVDGDRLLITNAETS